MTQEEYKKVCELIDQSKSELWLSPSHCLIVIAPRNISNLKKQIKQLVKE